MGFKLKHLLPLTGQWVLPPRPSAPPSALWSVQWPPPAFCSKFPEVAGTQENCWKSFPERGRRFRSHSRFPCRQDFPPKYSMDFKFPFPATVLSGFPMYSGHLWVESSYKTQGSSSRLHEFPLHLLPQTINILNNSGPHDRVLRCPSINLSPLWAVGLHQHSSAPDHSVIF